jgi:hypothetical protein
MRWRSLVKPAALTTDPSVEVLSAVAEPHVCRSGSLDPARLMGLGGLADNHHEYADFVDDGNLHGDRRVERLASLVHERRAHCRWIPARFGVEV